jgi:hypothetical protein
VATTTAALLGALVGAITGLVSATITNFVALRNERTRQEEARRASYVQALREHTAIAFAELFVVQHAINWITWFAKHDPGVLNDDKIASYDAEVHLAFPKLLGTMATVAGLNLGVYKELRPIMQRLYDLDVRTAAALRHIKADQEAALQSLQDCWAEASQLVTTLPPELARIMQVAQSQPRP